MEDRPWTFDPVYPEVYPTMSPKVIVVGADPNEGGRRPCRRDMGAWFRTASPTTAYWGNPTFYQATLEQVRACCHLTSRAESDEEVLRHLHYVDLKASGGTGRATTREVGAWVRVPAHLSQIVGYWLNYRPEYTILQGVHAQRVFEEVVAPALCAIWRESLKVGLLHPSQQNVGHLNDPAYLTALKEVDKQLRRLDKPLVRWIRRSKRQAAHWGVLGKA